MFNVPTGAIMILLFSVRSNDSLDFLTARIYLLNCAVYSMNNCLVFNDESKTDCNQCVGNI